MELVVVGVGAVSGHPVSESVVPVAVQAVVPSHVGPGSPTLVHHGIGVVPGRVSLN